MSDDEKPNNDHDGDHIDTKPAALTADLLSKNRFSARDEDFSGANDEAIALKISALEEEHRDLDAAILALETTSPYERLTIARLKKKKLQLKDQIQALKEQMLPDIIA